jgi:hypothetical protein
MAFIPEILPFSKEIVSALGHDSSSVIILPFTKFILQPMFKFRIMLWHKCGLN